VLLPVTLLRRRADMVAVIGAALAAKASGMGHRRIAAALGRPAETVRGWLRRFAGRVEAVRGVFTVLLRALAADPVMPEPAGGGWADALVAMAAAAAAAVARFVVMVPLWEWVAAVSEGRLLAPGWPTQWINTS
jgi:Homeodomain-like domain